MKVRKGFVSNSSSSSFIVPLPKGFEVTPENVKSYFFGDNTRVIGYDEAIPVDVAVDQIIEQLKDQQPNSESAMQEAFSGYMADSPKLDQFFDRAANSYDWDVYHAAMDKFVKEKIQEFKNEFKDSDIFCFSFSDDYTIGAVMEHGNTFDRVPHCRISHH
jgi:hypothetical protein